jgi:hypothetical protein
MSVKVRTKGAEKAGWQRSLASRTPKSIILGAVAWLNFSANATAPFFACTTYTMTNQVARDNQVQAEYADIVIFLRAR